MENNFSKNLAELMQAHGVSQSALARCTGVSQAAISRYVKGLANPAAADLSSLAQSLGVSMDALWSGGDYTAEDRPRAAPPLSAVEIELAELKRSLQIVFRAMSEPRDLRRNK